MGILDWLLPRTMTEAPAYLDPSIWQHLIAISIIGMFFLILGLVMLYPKTPVPWGIKFRFLAMMTCVALGIGFLLGA